VGINGLDYKAKDRLTQSTIVEQNRQRMRVRRRLTKSSLTQHERSLNLRMDTSTARLVVGRVSPLVTRRCIN